MLKSLSLTSLLIITVLMSYGQTDPVYPMGVNLSVHKGFLIAHRPMIVPLQQDHIEGIEANFLIRSTGKRHWQQQYGYPEMGVSLAAWDLGSKNQLGMGVALIPYLDFPLTRGRNSSLDVKFGWGIGYVEKTFHATENHKNVAIGSHLNCALILQPRFKTKISERFDFNTGLSITHYSNGSVVTPNLGLNLLSVTGGLTYKFGEKNDLKAEPLPPFVKSRRYTVYGAAALKQVYPAEGKTYFAGIFSANHTWQMTRKSGFGFGLDIFYDNSVNHKLEERDLKLNSSLEEFKLGIHSGYELVISDLSVVINIGGYLYTKLTNDGYIYHRFGLRYRLSEKIFVLMHLKSHWGKADFIEWGIGYRIDKYRDK